MGVSFIICEYKSSQKMATSFNNYVEDSHMRGSLYMCCVYFEFALNVVGVSCRNQGVA